MNMKEMRRIGAGLLSVGPLVAVFLFALGQVDAPWGRAVAEAANTAQQPAADLQKEPCAEVSAVLLAVGHQSLPDQARREYDGKLLKVSGTVDSVDSQAMLFLTMTDGPSVGCVFDESAEPETRLIRPGRKVTVIGRCKFMDSMVVLEDCRLQ